MPQGEVSEAPIPVSTTIGISAFGSTLGGAPFPMLIDTGTVLTTRAVASAAPQVATDSLELLAAPDGSDGGAAPVERAEFDQVPIFVAPLYPVGIGANTTQYGGVLGGDLLQRFSLALDYATPAIELRASEIDCSCQLADDCNAVFGFTLGGGGSISLGDQVYAYPPTRVTFDACLEAASDPIVQGIACRAASTPGGTIIYQPGYEPDQPPGTDVRLLVATGFDGILIASTAWDRLRGPGAAEQLLATGTVVPLRFGDRDATVSAVKVQLGVGCQTPSCDAMVLVGREGLLGACGELARSRRLRWAAGHDDGSPPNCDAMDSSCPPAIDPVTGKGPCLTCLPGNDACGDPNRCNDLNQPAAAYLELAGPMDVYLVDDTAPVLDGINNDIRPLLSDVEGIVGTALLSRLAMRIDYPNRRMIARCAAGATGCTTFPRYSCPDNVNDCGPRGVDSPRLCNLPSSYGTQVIKAGDTTCRGAPDP